MQQAAGEFPQQVPDAEHRVPGDAVGKFPGAPGRLGLLEMTVGPVETIRQILVGVANQFLCAGVEAGVVQQKPVGGPAERLVEQGEDRIVAVAIERLFGAGDEVVRIWAKT